MIVSMDYIFSFEKLIVWQKARNLVKKIYSLPLPDQEVYGLNMQMKRASVSISSNIAEGASRNTFKEKSRFINLAYGSLMELYSQILVCLDLGYIDQSNHDELKSLIVEIHNMLNGLLKSFNSSQTNV